MIFWNYLNLESNNIFVAISLVILATLFLEYTQIITLQHVFVTQISIKIQFLL